MRLSRVRMAFRMSAFAAVVVGIVVPARVAEATEAHAATQSISWVSPAAYREQLAAHPAVAPGAATTASTIYCTLDPEEPYYYRGNVNSTGVARCTQPPDVWNGKLILWAYISNHYTGVAQDVSNTPPNQWTGHDYISNYSAATTCERGIHYHTNMEADAFHVNWAHYSANSGTTVPC